MYHSISDDSYNLSVSIKNFKKQMNFMKNNGYNTINLEDLSKKNYKKLFIITFDDGYEDIYLNAMPILEELNFTATCFLVSSLIGKYNIWDINNKSYKKKKLMNENQINNWLNKKLSIGAHSADHKDLKKLNYNDKSYQIIEPIKKIKNIFNKDIKTFSYPYGHFDEESVKIVSENYNFAVTTQRSRFSFNKFENCKLPRVPINQNDTFLKFYIKIKTIYEDIKFKK